VQRLYIGEAEATIDAKNRVTVPKKFKGMLPAAQGGVITVWLVPGYKEVAFSVMDDIEGSAWAERIARVGAGSGPAVRIKKLLERSERVELDTAGRILLPPSFMKRCGLSGKELVITGGGDSLRVYEKAVYERMLDESEDESNEDLWDAFQDLGAVPTVAVREETQGADANA